MFGSKGPVKLLILLMEYRITKLITIFVCRGHPNCKAQDVFFLGGVLGGASSRMFLN